MRQIFYHVGLCVAVISALFPVWAADLTVPPLTVEAQYLGLSSGPLCQAKLVALPKGLLLRSGSTTITETQLAGEIATAKPDVQAQLKKQQFFLLEQLSIEGLLVAEARAWASGEKRDAQEDDETVIRAYLQHVAKTAQVTDEELKAFYAANKEMLGDIAYEAVVDDMRSYLLNEKQQGLVDAHLNTLSERTVVEVDAAWMKKHAAQSLDNPVDRARRASKPTMVDFGASGCNACDLMAPILKELRQTYAEQCTFLYVDVRNEQILAARYGVQGIPDQRFYDKEGKEVFRHTGYFSREQILEKLAELGVK